MLKHDHLFLPKERVVWQKEASSSSISSVEGRQKEERGKQARNSRETQHTPSTTPQTTDDLAEEVQKNFAFARPGQWKAMPYASFRILANFERIDQMVSITNNDPDARVFGTFLDALGGNITVRQS